MTAGISSVYPHLIGCALGALMGMAAHVVVKRCAERCLSSLQPTNSTAITLKKYNITLICMYALSTLFGMSPMAFLVGMAVYTLMSLRDHSQTSGTYLKNGMFIPYVSSLAQAPLNQVVLSAPQQPHENFESRLDLGLGTPYTIQLLYDPQRDIFVEPHAICIADSDWSQSFHLLPYSFPYTATNGTVHLEISDTQKEHFLASYIENQWKNGHMRPPVWQKNQAPDAARIDQTPPQRTGYIDLRCLAQEGSFTIAYLRYDHKVYMKGANHRWVRVVSKQLGDYTYEDVKDKLQLSTWLSLRNMPSLTPSPPPPEDQIYRDHTTQPNEYLYILVVDDNTREKFILSPNRSINGLASTVFQAYWRPNNSTWKHELLVCMIECSHNGQLSLRREDKAALQCALKERRVQKPVDYSTEADSNAFV